MLFKYIWYFVLWQQFTIRTFISYVIIISSLFLHIHVHYLISLTRSEINSTFDNFYMSKDTQLQCKNCIFHLHLNFMIISFRYFIATQIGIYYVLFLLYLFNCSDLNRTGHTECPK